MHAVDLAELGKGQPLRKQKAQYRQQAEQPEGGRNVTADTPLAKSERVVAVAFEIGLDCLHESLILHSGGLRAARSIPTCGHK
ncbi:hypothetical protein D9M71_679690 [compost metagenome]